MFNKFLKFLYFLCLNVIYMYLYCKEGWTIMNRICIGLTSNHKNKIEY